ncbi:hypothetical protein Vadar_028259 [Vaccinium darrowii]|uniref:Uncharacterized protein n=1 Tax=Vaccinium darrowii TaxID=229202 RepID=A0ACB7YZW7_9ERIC|nr:hypothetical protein Vadar_028259 [Vaccinium darrowii]
MGLGGGAQRRRSKSRSTALRCHKMMRANKKVQRRVRRVWWEERRNVIQRLWSNLRWWWWLWSLDGVSAMGKVRVW